MENNFRDLFVDKINEQNSQYKLIKTDYGYYTITPSPSEKDINDFYKNIYFSSDSATAARSMDVGNTEELDRFYFDRQYNEIINYIEKYISTGKNIKILDIGCGRGGFVKHLQKNGFNNIYATEIDQNIEIPGVNLHNCSFLQYNSKELFDLITINAVLEHVLFPEEFIKKAWSLLKSNGHIRIEVPNDLSYTQYKSLNNQIVPNFFFYVPPEHINYFNFKSINNLLTKNGFSTTVKRTSWCMDFFIMMGLDYSKDKSLGKIGHIFRCNLESKLEEEFLINFYEKMAELEIGRVIIQYARKN